MLSSHAQPFTFFFFAIILYPFVSFWAKNAISRDDDETFMKTNSLLFAFECIDYTFSSDAQPFGFLFLKRSTFICIFLNSYYIVSWAKMARIDDDAEVYESKHYFYLDFL